MWARFVLYDCLYGGSRAAQIYRCSGSNHDAIEASSDGFDRLVGKCICFERRNDPGGFVWALRVGRWITFPNRLVVSFRISL